MFYDTISSLEKEQVPGYKDALVETKYDFSILQEKERKSLVSFTPYKVPSPLAITKDLPILVVGCPGSITEEQLEASYGSAERPSREDFEQFFASGDKIASIGRIIDFDDKFMLISAATCKGI